MQNEISAKEQEILSLEETNAQLKTNLEEQQQQIVESNDINISLKSEKEKLEQCLRDSFKKSSLSFVAKPTKSFTEYSTTSTGTLKQSFNKYLIKQTHKNNLSPNVNPIHSYPKQSLHRNFNSPILCHMLANPVSPCLDNSVNSSFGSIKSADSNASPIFMHKVNAASTPELLQLVHRTFSYQKLPTEASTLSVLSPLHNHLEQIHEFNGAMSCSQHRLVDSDSSEDEKLNNNINNANKNQNGHANLRTISKEKIIEISPKFCNCNWYKGMFNLYECRMATT